jgi:nucleoside phosphorylase
MRIYGSIHYPQRYQTIGWILRLNVSLIISPQYTVRKNLDDRGNPEHTPAALLQSATRLCYTAMLLIVAALAEELQVAIDLCSSCAKTNLGGARLRSGVFCGKTIHFLKTGVGPERATKKLDAVLSSFSPRRILIIGYAGALSPAIGLGDLIAMRRASIFGEKRTPRLPLEQLEIAETYDLDGSLELLSFAQAAGLTAHVGDGLTSPYIIGSPLQKQVLHRRFQALSIDMETAALARSARAAGIPVTCVRVISDDAADDFLAPFTYDPDASSMDRALRVLGAGNWGKRYHTWRQRAEKARKNLAELLRVWLDVWSRGGE